MKTKTRNSNICRRALLLIATGGALTSAAVGGTAGAINRNAVESPVNPFKAEDYAAFRSQLRAFYPDWGQGDRDVVKDPRSTESYERIENDLKAWCAAHPDYDALDLRRECYMAMRRASARRGSAPRLSRTLTTSASVSMVEAASSSSPARRSGGEPIDSSISVTAKAEKGKAKL